MMDTWADERERLLLCIEQWQRYAGREHRRAVRLWRAAGLAITALARTPRNDELVGRAQIACVNAMYDEDVRRAD